jgi:hypothetical protein
MWGSVCVQRRQNPFKIFSETGWNSVKNLDKLRCGLFHSGMEHGLTAELPAEKANRLITRDLSRGLGN